MSKTEEELKIYIKEYMDEKNREISSNIITIFLWGFSVGMVFSYANITPLMIGMIVGYIIGKKNIHFLDYYIKKFVSLIDINKLNKFNLQSDILNNKDSILPNK